MVIEYIRYQVPAARHDEFQAAWKTAEKTLDEAPECLAYAISQGVEEPDNFIVRLEWTSLEDHEQGFRGSPAFGHFFAAVKPFFQQIEEMRHYVEIGALASS
jgi:quinol monooxygenase YgiN